MNDMILFGLLLWDNKIIKMSNDGVQEHNHLYSMGLLPKIQGRYLSSHKMIPRVKEKILKEKAPKIK